MSLGPEFIVEIALTEDERRSGEIGMGLAQLAMEDRSFSGPPSATTGACVALDVSRLAPTLAVMTSEGCIS